MSGHEVALVEVFQPSQELAVVDRRLVSQPPIASAGCRALYRDGHGAESAQF